MNFHVGAEDADMNLRIPGARVADEGVEQSPRDVGRCGRGETGAGAAAGIGRQGELGNDQQPGRRGQIAQAAVHPAVLVGKHPESQQPGQQRARLRDGVTALGTDKDQQPAADLAGAAALDHHPGLGHPLQQTDHRRLSR